ncbi:MAG: hypothetical protein ACK2T6_07015, partial [Anaerolineae bacterium]
MSNATPTGPRAAAVARNALTGGGRFVVSALLALVVTPYLLAQLGGDAFGLWALAGATVSVVRLLDLGLGRSMTRAVAAESGRGRPTAALEDLATGRAIMLGVGVIVVLCVWLARDALASTILRVPVALLPAAR